MIRDLSLRDLVVNPFTGIGTLLAVLGGWLKLPILSAIWGAMVANAGALFAAAGVASRFPSMVPILTAAELQLIAFLTGGLFVLTRLDRVLDGVLRRLRSNDTGDDTSDTPN